MSATRETVPRQDNPIGTIAEVHGPIVDNTCRRLPSIHEALYAALNSERYTFEVYQHLDERHVRAITLHTTSGLQRGMPFFDTGAPVHVPVSAECLGRLVNVFGEPLDGGPALGQLMDVLRELQVGRAPGRLLDIHVWHHLPADGGTQVTSRRPLLPARVSSEQVSYPPVLYLEPARFAAGLIDEYLFAVLHEIFYDSLMAENQRRFQQMDQAVNRLQRDLADLRGQRNTLRQEEITEEIEVIMLSAEALSRPLKPR